MHNNRTIEVTTHPMGVTIFFGMGGAGKTVGGVTKIFDSQKGGHKNICRTKGGVIKILSIDFFVSRIFRCREYAFAQS